MWFIDKEYERAGYKIGVGKKEKWRMSLFSAGLDQENWEELDRELEEAKINVFRTKDTIFGIETEEKDAIN